MGDRMRGRGAPRRPHLRRAAGRSPAGWPTSSRTPASNGWGWWRPTPSTSRSCSSQPRWRCALRPAQLPPRRRPPSRHLQPDRPGCRLRRARRRRSDRQPRRRRSIEPGDAATIGPDALSPLAEAHTDPDQVAIWLFTSGTTGEPKAAVLRHRHLASYVISTVEFMARRGGRGRAGQRAAVPRRRHLGRPVPVYAGRRIVYLPTFEPEEWVRWRAREGDHPRHGGADDAGPDPGRCSSSAARGCRSCAHLSYGGGRMPVAVIERALRLLPDVDFVNAYGLTETSSTIAVLGPDDHRDAIASDDPTCGAGWVGRPAAAALELEIRAPTAEPLAAGQPGRSTCGASRSRASTSGAAVLHRRRLVPHQRRRPPRRGRLPLRRRPARRRDRAGRREHVAGRDRGRAAAAPGGRRCGRGGRARRRMGRRGGGRRRAASGFGADETELRSRFATACVRPSMPARRPDPRRAALQRDGQAAPPGPARRASPGSTDRPLGRSARPVGRK